MKRAFTLIEMVLVLTVLAIVAHLAVNSLGTVRENRLRVAADRQLDEIAVAVEAFLSDIGRLPKLVAMTNDYGQEVMTLAELWQRPSYLPMAAVTNVEGVLVIRGWNGPYLKLPQGESKLRDPWGNPIESPDAAGLNRLVASADKRVVAVAHFGRRGQAIDRVERSLLSESELNGELVVTAIGADSCYCHESHEGVDATIKGVRANASQFLFTKLLAGEKTLAVTTTNGEHIVKSIRFKGPARKVEIQLP